MFALVTADAVRRTAADLLASHTHTTTLDVKRALRAEGYCATQDDVSALMAMLAVGEGWHALSNGRFRRYFAVPVFRGVGMN